MGNANQKSEDNRVSDYGGIGVSEKKTPTPRYSDTPILRHLFSVLCLLSFIFLNGCATTASLQQQKEAEFHFKMGISSLQEGNFQMAYVHLQRALNLNPDNKDVLHGLGIVYLHFEKFKESEDYFLKAIYINPDFSEAHNNLGTVYMRTGRLEKAIKSFKKALSNPLYRSPETAFYNMGMSYYRMGNFDLAVDAFRDSIRRAPMFSRPYYGLALAFNRAGRYGDATEAISRAIEIDPVYAGDRIKFINDIRQRVLAAKGEDEKDLKDFLEIMKY